MNRFFAFAALAVLSTAQLSTVAQAAAAMIVPEAPTVQSGELARGSCPEPPC